MTSRRQNVSGISPIAGSTHTGMWLERYRHRYRVTGQAAASNPDYSDNHLMQAIRLLPNDVYNKRYAVWHHDVSQISDVRLLELTTISRMVVGHASQAVLESGVQLHHTYGTPVIPGQSLKGLIAHYAHQYYGPDWLNPDSEGIRQGHKIGKYAELLFGSTDSAGYVQFLDAMWKPTDDRPLSKDVISVHQTKYYRENTPPTDTDSPTVVTFLAVRNNQSFILPLVGPVEWIDIVVTLLTDALKNHGIGAKTNAGYGRMKVEAFVDSNQQVVEAFVDPVQQAVDTFVTTHKLDTLATAANKNAIIDQAFRAFVREQKSMDIKVQILVARMIRDAMKANGRDSSLAYQDMRKLADRNL